MAKHRASTAVDCNICNKTIGRRADLARHMRLHATNKEELMHACPYLGCTYKTLQRSNLATHLNVHSRERPHKCPVDGCDFISADPGSLTRHRKEIHGYEPKGNSESHPSAITRKATRRQRRISPYTTTSSASPGSSGCSVSPLDPSSGMYRSPRPQVPQMLDLSPPSSLLLADSQGNIKNTFAAYSTELITKLPKVNGDTAPAPNPEPENSLPLTSGLLTAPEAPAVEHPQLPVHEQEDLYAVDVLAHPVSETTPNEVSDAAFDNFLAQLNDWQDNLKAAVAYTAPSAPTPVVQHTVGNVAMPTPISLPPPVAQYMVDSVPVPTPVSLPPPVAQYMVDSVSVPTPAPLPSYEYTVNNALYSYPTEAVSFDAQFSQPYSFAAPDMGVYPQVVDQTYFYPAPAATSVFPMQGLYLY